MGQKWEKKIERALLIYCSFVPKCDYLTIFKFGLGKIPNFSKLRQTTPNLIKPPKYHYTQNTFVYPNNSIDQKNKL